LFSDREARFAKAQCISARDRQVLQTAGLAAYSVDRRSIPRLPVWPQFFVLDEGIHKINSLLEWLPIWQRESPQILRSAVGLTGDAADDCRNVQIEERIAVKLCTRQFNQMDRVDYHNPVARE
jgi:hypothetical protein